MTPPESSAAGARRLLAEISADRAALSERCEELARFTTPPVTPAVLSSDTIRVADELRRFRHFVRHAYGSRLDESRVQALAVQWTSALPTLDRDLDDFGEFLRRLAQAAEHGA